MTSNPGFSHGLKEAVPLVESVATSVVASLNIDIRDGPLVSVPDHNCQPSRIMDRTCRQLAQTTKTEGLTSTSDYIQYAFVSAKSGSSLCKGQRCEAIIGKPTTVTWSLGPYLSDFIVQLASTQSVGCLHAPLVCQLCLSAGVPQTRWQTNGPVEY